MAMGSLWASYGTERRQERLLEPEPRLQGPKRGPRHSENSHLSRSLTSTTDVLMMTVLSSWTSTLVHATDYNSSPGPEQRDSGQSDKWTMTDTRDERRAELGTKLFANRRKQYERNLLGDEEYHYKIFARSRAKVRHYFSGTSIRYWLEMPATHFGTLERIFYKPLCRTFRLQCLFIPPARSLQSFASTGFSFWSFSSVRCRQLAGQ